MRIDCSGTTAAIMGHSIGTNQAWCLFVPLHLRFRLPAYLYFHLWKQYEVAKATEASKQTEKLRAQGMDAAQIRAYLERYLPATPILYNLQRA